MYIQRYKNVIAIILTLLLVLAPTASAAQRSTVYSVGPDTGAIEASQGVITAISDSNGPLPESGYAVTVPAGDSDPLIQLLWKLLRVYATVEGKTAPAALSVDWDYNSLISGLDTPGVYTHTASILAGGYRFAEGVPQALSIVVTVTEAAETEPDVIQRFETMSNRYAYAVSQNSGWQEFWDGYMSGGIWPMSWICYTTEGETLYADILWENPEPDMSQAGIVAVRGTAVLPENSVLAEGLTLPAIEAPVSIQAEPTLECWCADADVVYIPWSMGELEDNDSIRFLASVNGREWEDALEWMDTNGESVCMWINFLEEGSTYQVKVAWDGGETNVFEFTWNGAVTNAGPVEGDRDGGDTGGNPTITITQPKPEPKPVRESGPAPKPVPVAVPAAEPDPVMPISTPSISKAEDGEPANEPFYEEVTDTYSLLSGTRLLMMRESGAVRFSKQDVTVTLSEAALDAMALTDDSRFFIGLEKLEQGFVLTAELDGVPLAPLPDTAVILPFNLSAEGSVLTLHNEQGISVCNGSYDPELGVASFTIQTTGRYTVVETTAKSETPLIPKDTAAGQPIIETEDKPVIQPPSAELRDEPASQPPSAELGDVPVSQAPAVAQESERSYLFSPAFALSIAALVLGLLLWKRCRK